MRLVLTPGLSERIWHDTPEPAVKAGDFEVVRGPSGAMTMWLACPGCGQVKVLEVNTIAERIGSDGPAWRLSGTDAAPTLYPSVEHRGCWHGWVTDGEATPC